MGRSAAAPAHRAGLAGQCEILRTAAARCPRGQEIADDAERNPRALPCDGFRSGIDHAVDFGANLPDADFKRSLRSLPWILPSWVAGSCAAICVASRYGRELLPRARRFILRTPDRPFAACLMRCDIDLQVIGQGVESLLAVIGPGSRRRDAGDVADGGSHGAAQRRVGQAKRRHAFSICPAPPATAARCRARRNRGRTVPRRQAPPGRSKCRSARTTAQKSAPCAAAPAPARPAPGQLSPS